MDVSAGAALAVAAVAVLLALAALAWAGLARRGLNRRLVASVARLDVEEPLGLGDTGGGLEATLAALEKAAGGAVGRAHDIQVVADRMSAALDHVTEAVVVYDERGNAVYRNSCAAAVLADRHVEALAATTIRDLVDRALAGERARQTLDLFGPPRRTLAITAVPLAGARHALGAVAVIDDVSERRRLEAVRRDFVANISHELKTPVGALGLLAETLAAEDDPEIVSRLAQRMQTEAARVGRIIDDLLDLSRIEAQESPEREPVPLHLVVAEAVERVRRVAEHHRITIEAPEVPRTTHVLGDRRQLVAALHSLLENAVKYSDDGSEVSVSVRDAGGTVEIVVADHGIGIPARDLERIFERFYRVDRARARDTGGTGLGLAIVRHVATNHGGDVRVQSQEGVGSTFTLRLPAGRGITVSAEAV